MYNGKLNEYIEKLPVKSIIIAKNLYKKLFYNLSEAAFIKNLERLVKKEIISVIGKGIYYKPQKSFLGTVGISDNEILQYFINDNKAGVEKGYALYNKYGLTTQVAKKIQLYSNKILFNKQVLKNVTLEKFNFKYTPKLTFTVEYMEVLENYRNIEDLNYKALYSFCKKIADEYDENKLEIVLQSGFYKKRTIAFLRHILDYFNVNNNLKKFLNATSKYDYLKMEILSNAAA